MDDVGTVTGVHGIGNHQAGRPPNDVAAVLSERWTAALQRGLGRHAYPRAEVAYYAHLLAREQPQGAHDPAYLRATEQKSLLRWAATLGAPDEIAQGRLTQPARSAADWIARRFGLDAAFVRRLVSVFCREVECYFGDPERRRGVQALLAAAITRHGSRIVVAHSLGSVVAYETLWAHPDHGVDLLITLGSPLGLPDVIFDRLLPAPVDGAGARPPELRRWVNIADPGDIVAVPRGLARRFHGVDADLTDTAGTVNPHTVVGYLSCPATAETLRQDR